MLIWVILLVILSALLFVQNISLQIAALDLPIPPRLTILWSVLILAVALGMLATLVSERRARAKARPPTRPTAPAPDPPRAKPTEEAGGELEEEPGGQP